MYRPGVDENGAGSGVLVSENGVVVVVAQTAGTRGLETPRSLVFNENEAWGVEWP
jgi:hypothetical protein